jgi:hypothetical protein
LRLRLKPRHEAEAARWAGGAMVASSTATHFMFSGMAEARDTASIGGIRSVNRNADATIPNGLLDGATQVGGDPSATDVTEEVTRLVVDPDDSMGSIGWNRLRPKRRRNVQGWLTFTATPRGQAGEGCPKEGEQR